MARVDDATLDFDLLTVFFETVRERVETAFAFVTVRDRVPVDLAGTTRFVVLVTFLVFDLTAPDTRLASEKVRKKTRSRDWEAGLIIVSSGLCYIRAAECTPNNILN